jgi:hypothetical protein
MGRSGRQEPGCGETSGARRGRAALALGLLVAGASTALAHDLWLVPPEDGAQVGVPVEVEVSVGMDFPTSLHALDPERLTVSAVGPDGAWAEVVLRRDEPGNRTLASFTPTSPGAWLVSAATLPNRLEMEAAKFNDYLLHDGMPHVLAGRMDRGELDRDAAERYSKHVKAVVLVEMAGGEAARAVVGQELEIVLLRDPLGAATGETLPVQVLFRGAPLEHANLCWDHPGNGEDFSGQTWTDADGRALIPLAQGGAMTLRLVHMTRPMAADHEWESFWASCTFRVPTDPRARADR